MPRFLPTPGNTDVIRGEKDETEARTKVVVRRTFLELEEEVSGNIRRTFGVDLDAPVLFFDGG